MEDDRVDSQPEVGSIPAVESAEKLHNHGYTVQIDKDAIRNNDCIPPGVKEWLLRLPETLKFDQPVILVVGSNGSGKSTFARALFEARKMAVKSAHPENSAKIAGIPLDRQDVALEIAKALRVRDGGRETFNSRLIEGNTAIKIMRDWADNQVLLPQHETAHEMSGGEFTHRRSTRQLFDLAVRTLTGQIEEGRRRNPAIQIIYDEPEAGLDVSGQLGLAGSIPSMIKPSLGDTLLVPTNSLALYLSDLPRLDMDAPEKGVGYRSQEEKDRILDQLK